MSDAMPGAMLSRSDVERCLSYIRELSAALSAEVRSLSTAAWAGPTNCPPWQVRDIVVASEPAVVAAALDGVTDSFERVLGGLDEAGLSTVAFHRRGNRPARWFAAHRLAEIAFHRWDFQQSLGQNAVFDEGVAALLLPTLLESNAPRTYAAGLSAERGTGERYLLAVAGDPAARWLITIHPDRLDAVPGAAPADAADATLTGPAAALALLAYGRQALAELERAGTLRIGGDAAIAARFPAVFPRP